MKERKLTDQEISILQKIVEDSIEAVSYYNPRRQLGEVVRELSNEEILNILKPLEDRNILTLEPNLRFGFFHRRCGYSVNLKEAKKLYESYLEEKEKKRTTKR